MKRPAYCPDDAYAAEAQARYHVRQLRILYQSLALYIVVIPALFALNSITSYGVWWAIWPTLGMLIDLGLKASRVIGDRIFWSHDWEERKVARLLAAKDK